NYYAFFRAFSYRPIGVLLTPAAHDFDHAIMCRRFSRKPSKDAIKLRERLKSRSKCDFADAHIRVSQQITRSGEPSACDVLDKIDTGHLLEVLAQIIRVHIGRLRDSFQGKLFA